MQRVHAELKAQVWGPWGQHLSGPPPPPNTSNPTRLLQLWDYEARLSIQVRGYCHVAAVDCSTPFNMQSCAYPVRWLTANIQGKRPESAQLSEGIFPREMHSYI